MKSKFLSAIVTVAVCLGLLLVPAMVTANPGLDCGIEIEPAMQKVGFGEDFDVNISVKNPTAREIDTAMVHIDFTASLLEVSSIDGGSAVGSPFTIDLAGPDWNNTEGWIDYDSGLLGSTTTETDFVVATIHMKSKSASGLATLEFVKDSGDPDYDMETGILKAGPDYLNWTMVVNGQVKAGQAALSVDLGGDLAYAVTSPGACVDAYGNPGVCNGTQYRMIAGIVGPNVLARADFCPVLDRASSLGIPVKLHSVDILIDPASGDMVKQTVNLEAFLAPPDVPVMGYYPTTIVRDYVYPGGPGSHGAPYWPGKNWSYNVNMFLPDLGIWANGTYWANVTSVDMVTFAVNCGAPVTLPAWHIEVRSPGPGGVVTDDNWYCDYIGTGAFVKMIDYMTYTSPETTLLSGTTGGPGAVAITGPSQTGILSLPNTTKWDWDVDVTLSAVDAPGSGWTFSHWQGDLVCDTNRDTTIKMTEDKSVLAMFCELAPALSCADTTKLVFTCRAGDPDPGDKTLDISNTGGGVLNWSASAASDTGWLGVTPTGGNLNASVHQPLTIHANCTGASGTYTGNITISGSPDIVVDVELVVSTAETIAVCRDLPGDALMADQTYPGRTFSVTVNWTAPQDQFNSIGLTDVAPDGWVVETDNSWCTPAADFNLSYGNKAEYMWADNYPKDTAFFATYNVTVPETAVPGSNYWEVCPNMSESWLEYFYDWNGSYSSCIGCENEMVVTLPGYVTGETRDVNANLLPDTLVTLKSGSSDVNSDESTPNYEMICWNTGSDYWLLATKDRYDALSTVVEGGKSPHNLNHTQYIDWSTPELLVNSYHVVNSTNLADFDFEGDYGLVPMACDMSYSLRSVNLWLFWPAEVKHIDTGVITDIDNFGLSVWKAMQSVDSWQNPS